MRPSEDILQVSDNDFPYEVLAHSSQRPVVVLFGADWDLGSRALEPLLERLVQSGQGLYRLAKVDVDASPSLVQQYRVQSIPAVKAFRNGQLVAEFNGQRSETQLGHFLQSLAPEPDDLSVSKGKHLLSRGEWADGADLFRKVLQQDPDNPQALLGLARSHLAQWHPELALPILREFPPSSEYLIAEQMLPLAEAMVTLEEPNEAEDDWSAIYNNALRLAGRGQLQAAIDGVFEVLRNDLTYQGGWARKVAVGLLHLLGEEHELSRAYRAELSSLLF